MARIRRFVKDNPIDPRKHPTEVDCGYSVFSSDGKRYVQLNTYGSSSRKIPGKISQTLQLDEAAARVLRDILHDAFPRAIP